ncbi:MAG: DUF2344 domain-containing protein, partial [Chloroflexota bacterium]
GIGLLKTEQVGLTAPSLQSQVRQAEYRVSVESEKGEAEVERAIRSFLDMEHVPWQHQRDREVRRYDLRPLVHRLWVVGWEERLCTLGMRLRSDSTATGRPEQVTAALGFTGRPRFIHRSRLILAGG